MNNMEKEYLKLVSKMRINNRRLSSNCIRVITAIMSEYKGDTTNPHDITGTHTQKELCELFDFSASAVSKAISKLDEAKLITKVDSHGSILIVPNFTVL